MNVTTPPDALADLAARLIEPQDRETFAGLISYFNSLPAGDELLRLAQFLGLLSLLGQRVPEAVRDLLEELREQTKTSSEYRAQVDRRLARLPQEIAEGIDAGAIAKAMSESFRQQVAATGLQDATALLNASARDIKALSGQISVTLKSVTQEYRGISATISAELTKLATASRHVQEHNARLIVQERSRSWQWQGLLALVLFLAGGLCGIAIKKRQTADDLTNIYAQIQRIQTPQVPMVSLPQRDPMQNRRVGATP